MHKLHIAHEQTHSQADLCTDSNMDPVDEAEDLLNFSRNTNQLLIPDIFSHPRHATFLSTTHSDYNSMLFHYYHVSKASTRLNNDVSSREEKHISSGRR